MTGTQALESIGGVLLALRDTEEVQRLGFQQCLMIFWPCLKII